MFVTTPHAKRAFQLQLREFKLHVQRVFDVDLDKNPFTNDTKSGGVWSCSYVCAREPISRAGFRKWEEGSR